jgi:molybdopterin converting factor small subunit
MKIQLLLFGIASDLVNASSLALEITDENSIFGLKKQLLATYAQLENINSYTFAVNEVYASDETIIKENDVVALIPPVSGG